MPKDILERNIKKASEKGQEAFIEKVYEVCEYSYLCHCQSHFMDNV